MSIPLLVVAASSQQLVAAVSGRSIRVRGFTMEVSGNENPWTLRTGGATGTVMIGVPCSFDNAGDDGASRTIMQANDDGICTCNSGENLYLTIQAAQVLIGTLWYDLI